MREEQPSIGASPDNAESLVTHVTRRAMATEFVVLLPEQAADAVETVVATLEHLDAIEQALTIYRNDSEVSRINLVADSKPVCVSESTFGLIRKAVSWSERTRGAFDITAGPLVEVWGFTERRGRKPSADEIAAAKERVGYEGLELCDPQRSVGFRKPGMQLNLGAIGKGDALDRLARQLCDQGCSDFLIHGGNSSVIAAGDQMPGSGQGWSVGLAHPSKPRRRLGGLALRDMALATSGSGKQFFHHRGKRYGHVIDPRSGYPSGDMLSLTVLMPSAADADACATGLFVAGTKEMQQLADQPWMPPWISVAEGRRQDAVEVAWSGEIIWVDEPA